MIMQEFVEDKLALQALRAPHLQHMPDIVESLTEEAEGREI